MHFDTYPELETERLYLRKMTLEDAPELFKILSDPLVVKDMGEAPFTNVEQAEGVIHFMNDLFENNQAFRLGIIRKEDNKLIGTCGYNAWEVNRGSRGEIAYDLGSEYWRKGYASETIKALLDFGFYTMGLHRIEAFINLDALPSMGILTKMGFKEDGILRGYAFFHGEFQDQRCYSLLKNRGKVKWKI